MFKTLIVDDEPQIRKGLRTIVPWEACGFAIVGEASDGAEALDLAAELRPDLVVTDVRMPRMSGIELARELRSRSPGTELLILSGYNEFAYAKEALQCGVTDYLLKPVDPEELGGALAKLHSRLWAAARTSLKEKEKAESLRDYYLGKLVRGELYEGGLDAAAEYGVLLQGGTFCIMVLSIERYGEFLLSLPGQEIGLKRFAIRNVSQEVLGSGGTLFELNEQQFGVVLTEPIAGDEVSVRRTAERIHDAVGRYVKESVTIGIGTAVRSPADVKRSYAEAVRALERKFFYDGEHLFVYRPDEADAAAMAGIRWDDGGLLQAIRDGNRKRVKAEIDALLAPQELRVVPLDTLKSFMVTTVIRLAKLTEEHHGDWQTFCSGKLEQLEHIIGYEANRRLIEFVHTLAFELCDYVESCKSRKPDNRIRDIVEHIAAHYREELNLKELSRLFYVNPVYLGQLFKKATGEYFNDYINKVRVGHARELLESTELSAAEIAEQVGYKYVDHFYRQFKQMYGVNPGELRRRSAGRGEQGG